ncbi:MAG: ATP-binding cassette domain-containing protein [Candidatus Scalindua sp.]
MDTMKENIKQKEEHKSHADVILSANNLVKAFGGQIVLNDISFNIRKGEVVLLRGENGSGKTTLVNILTGNLEPERGEIHISINGDREEFIWPRPWWKEINPLDHFTPERLAWEGVGRVWQDIRLFPTMTALENVAIASPEQSGENPVFALFSKKAKKENRQNAKTSSEWLSMLGLRERLDSSCDKISLGQMKRVAIARAIQAGAKILFLDEPLSGLDQEGISEVMGYLETLAKENSITLVIVEHVFNIPTILKLANTVWTLSNGKLTSNKSDEIIDDKTEEVNQFHHLLRQIAGENGKIHTEKLPNGAELATVIPEELVDFQSVLEVKGLVAKRGIRTVIDGLSLNLKKGHLYILEAPNGWGKSSLLDVITGIHPLESGKIKLKGKEIGLIPTHERIKMGLAYLRSQQSLFTSLSVKEQRKLANTNIPLFDNSLNGKSKGCYLSGGEKQKLLIEMLPEADVYLLDEPMIGLDKGSIEKVVELIKQMTGKGKTILITVPEPVKPRSDTN